MIQENVQLEYQGFNPDYQIRTFVSKVTEKLHLISPSDAAISLAFKKGKRAITASCRISSQAGTFFAETVSDSPIRAVQQIEYKIKQQLDHWKNWRFVDSPRQH